MRNDIHEEILERRTWSFNGLSSLWIFRQFQQMWLKMRLILSVVEELWVVWEGARSSTISYTFFHDHPTYISNFQKQRPCVAQLWGEGRNIILQHHSSQGSRQLTFVFIKQCLILCIYNNYLLFRVNFWLINLVQYFLGSNIRSDSI